MTESWRCQKCGAPIGLLGRFWKLFVRYIVHKMRVGPDPVLDFFTFAAHHTLSFREAIERQFAK